MAVNSVLLQPGWMSGTLLSDLIVAFVLVVVVKSVVVPTVKFFNAHRKLWKTVPSPTPHWLLGHVLQLPHNDDGYRKRVEMIRDFPFMFCYQISWLDNQVFLYHPEPIKKLLTTQIPKGYKNVKHLLGNGLITSSGKKWQRHRHMLTPVFYFEVLKTYVKTFNESIPLLTDWLEKVAESGESGDICKQLAILSYSNLSQCVMSQPAYKDGTPMPYAKAIETFSQTSMKRFYNPLMWSDKIFFCTKMGKEMLDACNTVHEAVRKIIRDRKEVLAQSDKNEKVSCATEDGTSLFFQSRKNKSLDFLDMLIQAKDEKGQGLGEQDIVDEVTTMFSAGQETTANAMSWFSYLLAKNQDWQEKCRAEVMEVCGSDGEILWEDIPKLKILSLCVKETLRLYPVASVVGRRLTSDMTFKNPYNSNQTVTLDKGTAVVVNFHTLHRHPDFWEDPEAFDPERFTAERSKDRPPFAYLPFSGSYRNCIGQNFALNQIKVTFCHILRRFRLRLPPGVKNIAMDPAITLQPHNGVLVKVEKI
ncbi:cytochrome P450 4F4-like [Clavelina lepadiformis]|uniref:cytochrome P450 4F4-like n=1 Tax=Clavelina lepadiformis TaxID=159417 RepID=UPI004041A5E5